MSRAGMLTALSCLVLFASPAAAIDHDAAISLLYVRAAAEALAEGRAEQAEQLARLASEFDDRSSDAWYLLARLASDEQSLTRTAVERASRAVELASWTVWDAAHGAALLASLYNRTGDHHRAVELIDRVDFRWPNMAMEADRLLRVELARALLALGRTAEAARAIAAARDRYPLDPMLYALELSGERYPSWEHRQTVELILAAADRSGRPEREHLELLLLYARRAPTTAELEWAIGAYLDRGGADPVVSLLLAPHDAARAERLYASLGGEERFDLTRSFLAQRGRFPGVVDRASRYTGLAWVDRRGDGLREEEISVVAGTIERWVRDANRDGVAELEVSLERGVPVRVVQRTAEAETELVYAQYPFLDRALVASGGESEQFRLRPRSVRLDVITALPAAGARYESEALLLEPVRTVGRAELAAWALSVERLDETGRIVEQTALDEGVPAVVRRDTNGDGRWDHLVVYEGGLPAVGLRDIDFDGRFEVFETYRDGVLVSLAVDADHDGVSELFHAFGALEVREWDLDGDGRIDIRELRDRAGRVVREYPVLERP